MNTSHSWWVTFPSTIPPHTRTNGSGIAGITCARQVPGPSRPSARGFARSTRRATWRASWRTTWRATQRTTRSATLYSAAGRVFVYYLAEAASLSEVGWNRISLLAPINHLKGFSIAKILQLGHCNIQSGAACHSQGFEDKNLGSSPKSSSSKPCECKPLRSVHSTHLNWYHLIIT